ncbi:MAG: hypothetical protein NTX51_19850 [Verrucomicrobia bacterium]|nr:hypothetical protein [Verrucomicrobiota bacterium]
MNKRIKSLLLAMGLVCLSLAALAQDLPPLPPDIPLPPNWDPVRAEQQNALLQQRYWQRQQEIFERDFLPWLHSPITLPNGQPYTRENEEAYRLEQLLALAAELSLAHEPDPEDPWLQNGTWPYLGGIENGFPAYWTGGDLGSFDGSLGGVITIGPAFSYGEALVVSTIPEPGVFSLVTIGLAALLVCRARKKDPISDPVQPPV